VDWIRVAQDRDRARCECGDEPSGSCATELIGRSADWSVGWLVVFLNTVLLNI
jgi:hypothetical protein